MKKSVVPGSIEASQTHICGQDIKPKSPPRMIDGMSDVLFPFDVNKKGNAVILHELEPKEPRLDHNSMLDVGDEIEGKRLSGYSETILTNVNVGGSGRTGRHTGQNIKINGYCYTTIISDWFNNVVPKLPHDNITQALSLQEK